MAGKSYKLPPETATALADLVQQAHQAFEGITNSTASVINDLYTGRDVSSGTQIPLDGVPFNAVNDPTQVAPNWSAVQVGANLFQARTRQLVTELVPAVPSFHAKAVFAEAEGQTEQQTRLMNWASRNSGLKQAARQAALFGLLGSHFGLKTVLDLDAEHKDQRLKWVAIPSSHCGYEPRHERFRYHQYQCQLSDLPPEYIAALSDPHTENLKPWDIVTLTEVYHPKFNHKGAGCPMSVYINLGSRATDPLAYAVGNSPDLNQHPLGEYAVTTILPDCPLHIDSYLDPAPGEYIAPPEVLSWIPVIRSIHKDLIQIEREVGRINNIILYDKKAFDKDAVAAMRQNPSGVELYLPVDTDQDGGAFERDNGVSHKMRPVERTSSLGELITALDTHLALLDQVVGANSFDTGVPAGPRKSAAEASLLAQAGSRRTRDRLSVIADMFSQAAQSACAFQRQAYGRTLKLPTGTGVIETLAVPNPKTARMAFRVEPVELGNLSKQGTLEMHSVSLSLLTQLKAADPAAVPSDVLVSVARGALLALGNEDAAARLKVPAAANGPEARIRDYIYGKTTEIPVLPNDDHATFIAAYQAEIEMAAVNSLENVPVTAIQDAITRHEEASGPVTTPAAPALPPGLPVGNIAPFEDPTNLTAL